ncbi:PIN domain nuclease [Candidatus Pacearchaeota archaeon]|nr:PIN domain nuclease [Candidatus Pacearchaeota archaeon]|tara:strand:- start:742 stop:1119 length:378 start_codon:yes stop_codon:yes gene_type:complete
MNNKMSYFLDTYAMIEIAKGNKKFEPFLDHDLYTSLYNLYEFYFVLLRDFNETIAQEFFYQFKRHLINPNNENIFKASEFKIKNRGKRLSYVDCLGYILALDNGLKFLTGDKEFENLENVEFVKK